MSTAAERVAVLGIRHHGPGSARSVLAELDRLRPEVVLIEGPADADPLLSLCAEPGMSPPVALLGYVVGEPRTSAFWPYAVFSPEWQAMTWATRSQNKIRSQTKIRSQIKTRNLPPRGPRCGRTRSRCWPGRRDTTTRSAGGTT